MISKEILEDRLNKLKHGLAELLTQRTRIAEAILIQRGAISEAEAVLGMIDEQEIEQTRMRDDGGNFIERDIPEDFDDKHDAGEQQANGRRVRRIS